ncbi:MAG: acetyl-CoA C-acyltransferase, partial [Gemmatimonadaceae bacterium]|nr:acetyl-CoA C-acyltransferase [Gemmatimonadaceae bacterium]
MSLDRTPVIVSAARTPIGRFLGGLAPLTAADLGAHAIRAAVARAGIDPSQVGEVVMGNVLQANVGQAPARQAAMKAGIPGAVPAYTVNKVCGSGLQAVMLAAQAIRAGDEQLLIAGGQESMSNAPHYVSGMRTGVKFGAQTMADGLIRDGLWCAFYDRHMGGHAEYTAKKAGISRERQDAFTLASHQKAVAAMAAGKFRAEIAPVEIAGRKGPTVIDTDESPRADTSLDALAKLKPAFPKDAPKEFNIDNVRCVK